MADSFRYGRSTVDRARRIYAILAHRVKEGNLSPMTYKVAGKQVGAHQRAMRYVLHKIQDECRTSGYPTITMLVVDQKSGLPNSGCDVSDEEAVEQERVRLLEVEWPEKAWW